MMDNKEIAKYHCSTCPATSICAYDWGFELPPEEVCLELRKEADDE